MATVTSTSGTGIAVLRDEKQKKAQSLWRIAVRRFFKHRMAVAGTVMLIGVILFCVGGAFFLSEDYSNKIELVNKFQPPSAEHPFGTDGVGRDVLARTIWGGQISLMIGVVSVGISVAVGTIIGLVSGFFGGWVDSLLMRFTEALLSIPVLVLLLLFSRSLMNITDQVTILGRTFYASVIAIVLIIGLLNWMRLARIVRSVVLSLKEQEFVTAATTLGARQGRILFQHVLPNCLAPIIVTATLGIGAAIVTEAYLSFLGFGVLPPTATWGNILTGAQAQLDEVPWVWIFPGVLIIITVLAINFIGDGLRDALDPRSTK